VKGQVFTSKMAIDLIDKPIYDAPKTRERIRLASEGPIEEFELHELPLLIKEFEQWQDNNPGGTWSDFYKIYLGGLRSEKFIPPWEEEETTIKVAELPKSKIKDKVKVKKIDLNQDFLKLMDTFSRLDSGQRETIDWILKRTFHKKNK